MRLKPIGKITKNYFKFEEKIVLVLLTKKLVNYIQKANFEIILLYCFLLFTFFMFIQSATHFNRPRLCLKIEFLIKKKNSVFRDHIHVTLVQCSLNSGLESRHRTGIRRANTKILITRILEHFDIFLKKEPQLNADKKINKNNLLSLI
ncbi:hypothetical protein BpHYR1_036192 [Brachionus plicatilis]|uniref:Uncharacterized protein n=1 Tax=Brachionus plicatilis TaxID=10195 RepID=A0A3M7RK85_BRAPC|nr:hypothetical protein BpHYR1_036192 [Brachionus plicatilis]